MSLFMKVHVQWMKLMKSQIVQKFQRFEILKQSSHFLTIWKKNYVQRVQNV